MSRTKDVLELERPPVSSLSLVILVAITIAVDVFFLAIFSLDLAVELLVLILSRFLAIMMYIGLQVTNYHFNDAVSLLISLSSLYTSFGVVSLAQRKHE
eukprot:468655-Ditylum_brightwellii.AAC.1